jgi:hypothetical protein
MSVPARADLERALHGLGIRCTVEGRDALAVAIPAADERGFEDGDLRARAVALARAHGFSHLAVELGGGASGAPSRAAVPRD